MAPEKINSLVFERSLTHVTRVEELNEWIPVRAPYSGEILGSIPAGGSADVQLAMARARAAQPQWAARSYVERGRVFLRFHDLLLQRQAEVLDIIQLETGKA